MDKQKRLIDRLILDSLKEMNVLWRNDEYYQHAYHPCQLRKEKVKRGKMKEGSEEEKEEEEEEEDGNIQRQDNTDDRMGGAAISPAIVAAARYAVVVAAAVQQQMRCCMPAVVDNQLQKFGMLIMLSLTTVPHLVVR